MASVAEHTTFLDARPVSHAARGVWDDAVSTRDRFALRIRQTLAEAGIKATVLVSHPGIYPPWIRMEAWVPRSAGEPSLRERCSLELVVDTLPYHESDIVVTARLARGKIKKAVTGFPRFGETDAVEWAKHALGRGPAPSNYTPILDALIGLMVALIPFVHGPRHNPVISWLRWNLDPLMFLILGSLGALMLGFFSLVDGSEGGGVLILLAIVGLVVSGLIGRRRAFAVSVVAQPAEAPANLILVDAWHAVVPDLGHDLEAVKEKLFARLAEVKALGFTVTEQNIAYQTPNGYMERSQLVVAKGQSVLHVQAYPFGNDAFIGWQSNLNWAKWGETGAILKRCNDGRETEYRDVRPATYVPNQFDLIDLNALTELVHRRIERELKVIMREKEIDAEIDFEIIRGDRDRALDAKRGRSFTAEETPSAGPHRSVRQILAWRPQAVTEGHGGFIERVLESSGEGSLKAAGFLALLAFGIFALAEWFGLLFSYATPPIFLTEEFSYQYFPWLDLALIASVSIGFKFYRHFGWQRTMLLFAVLYAAAALADCLFYVVISSNYTTVNEFWDWAYSEDRTHRYVWVPAAILYGVTTMMALAWFAPPLRSINRFGAGILVMGGGQALLATVSLSPWFDFVFQYSTTWYLPNFVLAGLVGYWLTRSAED